MSSPITTLAGTRAVEDVHAAGAFAEGGVGGGFVVATDSTADSLWSWAGRVSLNARRHDSGFFF